ncbi:GxxExxY protein [Desulforhopalus vacuolatus]|uniref:GxxExxY protein n=1 Tax=Desulforhopalus vacuolatus TaxID=40414 RepID=UPI00196595C6|nr:GxxExxY protein [Desulforhopalus vacuolatus]MBM9520456.1 GxxExxY protein [Desulforhopalus vacuolatus]
MLIHPDESYEIIGACFDVYNAMGAGFLESVYQECLALELGRRGVPFVQQKRILLSYRGTPLKQEYLADFVCHDKIIVEIKAVSTILSEHRAQVLNYLHATGYELGLLINFGHYPKVETERIVKHQRTTEDGMASEIH